MSGSMTRPTGTSATVGDCGRLWSTLIREYIPGLRVELTILPHDPNSCSIRLEVVDDSVMALDGSLLVNVWAVRDFHNPLHLISSIALFDLLIDSYRAIDRYFELGEAAAPARRGK